MIFKRPKKGELFSEVFQDIYWSTEGGLEEKKYIFLEGNDLENKFKSEKNFSILELGFGAGLNFFTTLELFAKNRKQDSKLNYISCEKYLLDEKTHREVLNDFPEIEVYTDNFFQKYKDLNPRYIEVHFPEFGVNLQILKGDALTNLKELETEIDCFYLDGFSPSKNPELWNKEIFFELARIGKENSSFATYSVSRSVKDALTESGFEWKESKGFGKKKGMLSGKLKNKLNRSNILSKEYSKRNHTKKIAIIGAGLAGSSVAYRLARLGYSIDLYDKKNSYAMAASGNKAAIFSPIHSIDRTPLSTLGEISYYDLLDEVEILKKDKNLEFQKTGVEEYYLIEEKDRIQKGIESHHWDSEIAYIKESNKDSKYFSVFYPNSGWLNPISLVKARLETIPKLETFFETEILSIKKLENEWELVSNKGKKVYEQIVFASSIEQIYSDYFKLPIRSFRGQVTEFKDQNFEKNVIIFDTGYQIPLEDSVLLGATYDREESEEPSAKLSNLLKERHQKFFTEKTLGDILSERIGFRATTPDHLPIAGRIYDEKEIKNKFQEIWKTNFKYNEMLPILDGLYLLTGLGSRGVLFSGILGEHIASLVYGKNSPIPNSVHSNIHPARFFFRDLKRKRI
ncbi:MAG: bifunctional tRNA (5-methylaminomethyl-2-thiouridine)(34)-methyltransferase MnmD/FAD-dependent 5-carboxymethylaminomethyl-2-thiouridine(34) oxidoreductase MnmC [Leptospiraceae bacterium]|nr:bifunctional tRNA (5-methylaminomethyl-2-thiouridine)(34)-methyltransferase MnmD/FAD-dependent 5-carboxymethylaminomethyl-2-thiouridine(34) oxidoreductase MnmC [Leptospiraceae bacterium]